MRRIRGRTLLVVLAAAAAIFVVAGGPATAGKLVTKNQIAPSAVTNKAIANGAITDAKLSKALRAKLGKTGSAGVNGAPGAPGAKGDTGARGPAGAFNVVDATGKVLGPLVGMATSPPYFDLLHPRRRPVDLRLGERPELSVDLLVRSDPLQVGGCAGQAYGTLSGYPLQTPIVLDGPPSAGSKIYIMQPAASAESFTYQSYRSSSGCTTSSAGVSNAYPAKEAGVLPSLTKPLTVVPAG